MLTKECIFNQMFHLELLVSVKWTHITDACKFNLYTQIIDDIKDIRKLLLLKFVVDFVHFFNITVELKR